MVGRVEAPVSSCYRLDCPSPLTSLHYNPKNPHLVAGGSYNGQLSWWDLRMAGSRSVAIEESHKDPVYSTRWTNSKTATEIVTASADGTVKWWDLRNMDRATKTLVVDVLNRDGGNMGDIGSAQAVSSLEYTPTIPTRLVEVAGVILVLLAFDLYCLAFCHVPVSHCLLAFAL